jgi:hypothetical protein
MNPPQPPSFACALPIHSNPFFIDTSTAPRFESADQSSWLVSIPKLFYNRRGWQQIVTTSYYLLSWLFTVVAASMQLRLLMQTAIHFSFK